ncbi:MAG: amidohydrolase [Promethearchaeota archaeon]
MTTKIFHGNIVVCDEKNSCFSYLIEKDGYIEFVGDEIPSKYKGKNIIELGEKALVPAFGDGHIHFSNYSLLSRLDVRDATSIDELGEIIRNYATEHPKEKVIIGFGASKHNVKEKRLITKKELDNYVSDRPVIIIVYDGHSAVGNTKMMDIFPEEIRNLRGFLYEKGHLFHEAFLEGMDYATKLVPTMSLIKSIIEGIHKTACFGNGLVHVVEGVGFPKDLDVDLVRFFAKGSINQFRIFFQTIEISKVIKRKLPRIGGCFATALDGCFGAQDAALIESYNNDPNNRGILFYDDETVKKFVDEANKNNLQVEMHVIGDAAFQQAVDALEYALKNHPRENHRHTLIHASLITDEGIKKCAKLGIGITLQPAFLKSPLEPYSYLEEILGKERAMANTPLKTLIDLGIHVSGGSDAPVTLPNPLDGIYGACNHYNSEQSVSIEQALRMYTYEVAYTSFDEDTRGTLEKGKIADMIILNKNPLELKPEQLNKLKIEKIYYGGKEYIKKRGLGRYLTKNLFGKKNKI